MGHIGKCAKYEIVKPMSTRRLIHQIRMAKQSMND